MMNETTPMNECVRQRECDGTDMARNIEKGRVAEKGQKRNGSVHVKGHALWRFDVSLL